MSIMSKAAEISNESRMLHDFESMEVFRSSVTFSSAVSVEYPDR